LLKKIELNEFLKRNQNAKDKNVEFVRMQTILQISIRAIVSIIFVVIIGYSGYLVSNDLLTLEEFAYFFLVFGTLIWPMMALAMIINIRSRGKASLERIQGILNEEVDIYDSEDVVDVDEIKGSIEFKNLTFSYPDATEPVLKDISFTIEKGETIGVLGRTGSGKTSVVDLLLRLYNVDENSIFVDGIDLMKLPIKKLRDSIGYVPQDGFLFSDSISKNISLSYGVQDGLYKEVEEAAILSDVHDNITEFTEGYQTIIGERGVTLSGGQRQRLSIARALIKNPPIMILDDSVSAVDTKTEETILSNLDKIRSDRTTIIIAHRISTLKTTDKIIIIDDGMILDVGSHEELLTRCEFYKDMVERQKLEDEIEVK
jgi:ATP-binding cassette subfamily B protein